MTLRAAAFLLPLTLLRAQQVPSKSPPDDEVTAYLNERRAPAIRAVAIQDLDTSGVVALGQGKYGEAEGIYLKMLDDYLEESRGIAGLARVYAAQGRKDDLIRTVRIALTLKHVAPDIYFTLADAAQQVNEYDLALATLAKARQEYPARGDVSFHIAAVYRAKGDPDTAIATLRKAVVLMPGSPGVMVALADDLAEEGRSQEATAAYASAFGVDPNDEAALLKRFAELAIRPRDLTVLEACARRAVQLAPDDAAALDALGQAYTWNGKPKAAVPLLDAAIAKAPDNNAYRYNLALALMQAGATDRASQEFETVLKMTSSGSEEERIRQLLSILTNGRK